MALHYFPPIVDAGFFGAILVGSREVIEGEHTPLALLAMALTGINPALRRESTATVEIQEAVEQYIKSNPMFAKLSAVSRRNSADTLNGAASIALQLAVKNAAANSTSIGHVMSSTMSSEGSEDAMLGGPQDMEKGELSITT